MDDDPVSNFLGYFQHALENLRALDKTDPGAADHANNFFSHGVFLGAYLAKHNDALAGVISKMPNTTNIQKDAAVISSLAEIGIKVDPSRA